MAIEKIYLDPNAQVDTPDQVVAKINTATANITRASSVSSAARPIASGEVGAVQLADEAFTSTQKTKLTGIATAATVDQTGPQMRDLIVAITDLDRTIVISRPVTGQKKIVALQTHSNGKTEVEQNSIAES